MQDCSFASLVPKGEPHGYSEVWDFSSLSLGADAALVRS